MTSKQRVQIIDLCPEIGSGYLWAFFPHTVCYELLGAEVSSPSCTPELSTNTDLEECSAQVCGEREEERNEVLAGWGSTASAH